MKTLDPRPAKDACQHATGYWINRKAGSFRCYDCGFQFSIRDVPKLRGREIDTPRR